MGSYQDNPEKNEKNNPETKSRGSYNENLVFIIFLILILLLLGGNDLSSQYKTEPA